VNNPDTLKEIASNPHSLTFTSTLHDGEEIIIRPLGKDDEDSLTEFLENLSPLTREFYTLDSYDRVTAKEMCDAIAQYDKLRFVVVSKSSQKIVAILEYSLDIPADDQERFLRNGVSIDGQTVRFGPCISDKYQGRGIGQSLFPFVVKIAKKLNRSRIILWGGVFADNDRALNFYKKVGFLEIGRFKSSDNRDSIDMMLGI
jgi:diamine N-acetyltransferase